MKLVTLTAAAMLAATTLTAGDHAGKTEAENKKDCTPKSCCCCCCCHNLKGKKVKICPMPGTAANQQNAIPGVMQITEGEMVIYAIPVDGTQNNAQTAQNAAPAQGGTSAPAN